ncbi:T9SS type A sorting domain-containing protein [bacterium]|nr:T9SS type A sorting domain-containing protein [bacterium]
MNTKKLLVSSLVLTCFVYQSEAFSQTPINKIEWSSFNQGFGAASSAGTQICSALGQSFVGSAQNANSQIASGFLVHPLICETGTAVEEKAQEESQLPASYELEQNYPNPFNPSTTIAFALPKLSEVTLKVFDASGREVATLVEGRLLAGRHEVVLDARPFSSGVYFYRLQAGEFSQTRRLTLVK